MQLPTLCSHAVAARVLTAIPTSMSLSGTAFSDLAITTKAVGCSVWQKSFYDHIIRNKDDYVKIWNYIDNNPQKWTMDKYYCEW